MRGSNPMRTTSFRVTRLEERAGLRSDADGECGHCRGRRDLGRTVLFDQVQGGPVVLRPGMIDMPTPCAQCGRDLNVHIVVRHVDIISERRREMGQEPLEGGGAVYKPPMVRFGAGAL